MVRARRIRSEKLRERQYRERQARSLVEKGVEGDRENKVEHMWGQVKQVMVDSAREVCGLVKGEEKNPKSVWWNNEVKATVSRK